ncbi:MAG TPA: hypothetical protein VMY39_03820 [Planctomycetota bacterium]|nr:hypothetical protein [Planctomycetota bacterium]
MRRLALLVAATLLTLASASALAQDAKPAEGPEPGRRTVVLDTSGFWRLHYTYRPFVVRSADGLAPVLYKHDLWINRETDPPGRGWESPDFDDARWRRLPGTPFPETACSWLKLPDLNFGFTSMDGSSPFLAHLAMRGKFRVTDPSKVKGLVLSVAYRGGVVVLLNGKEVARGHMPAGAVTSDTLANDYPTEAFAKPDGTALKGFDEIKSCRDRCEMHNRDLADVRIPTTLLRKGVNVLAVAVHRAPYDGIVTKHQKPGAAFVVTWSTCGLLRVRLAAADADGLVPNVQRPAGV